MIWIVGVGRAGGGIRTPSAPPPRVYVAEWIGLTGSVAALVMMAPALILRLAAPRACRMLALAQRRVLCSSFGQLAVLHLPPKRKPLPTFVPFSMAELPSGTSSDEGYEANNLRGTWKRASAIPRPTLAPAAAVGPMLGAYGGLRIRCRLSEAGKAVAHLDLLPPLRCTVVSSPIGMGTSLPRVRLATPPACMLGWRNVVTATSRGVVAGAGRLTAEDGPL
jgi:hypothetical protein